MSFTMLVPTMNVFLLFRPVSRYLLFPGTVLCYQKGTYSFSTTHVHDISTRVSLEVAKKVSFRAEKLKI